jgi:phenylpyruvate tautomerase PptA (4-oxalocrotonate tautomerase family)
MPLVTVYTSAPSPAEDRARALLAGLSKRLAEHLRKPESYVMTCLVPQTTMTFGGSEAPSCYVEVKNIGQFSPEVTRAVSADLCARLGDALGVEQGRIYIEFSDAKPHLWGFNGSTFG